MKLSLVIAAYNEEKAIEKVVSEAVDYVDEIVVVDDGSDDNTAKSVINYIKNNPRNNKKIKLIEHEKRLGKAAALDTGVENSSGDVVIFTEADNTYPACYFPRLAKEIEDGADLVIGSRFLSPQLNNLSFSHRLGNKIFSGLVSYMSSNHITDSLSGMRAVRREIFPRINVNSRSLGYEPKVTAKAAKLGYKIKEIPITYRKGKKKGHLQRIREGIKIPFSLINIAYTETTLLSKMIMIPSFLIGIIGIVMAVLLARDYLILGIVKHPYSPLIAALSLILSTQLLSLGLIIDNITKKLSRIEEIVKKG